MSVSLIYRDFLDAWTSSPTWESLQQGYIERHMDLLKVYHANFFTWQAQDPAAVLRDYQMRWGAEPEKAANLVERLQSANIKNLMQRGYDAARQLLSPRQDPDAIGFVGLGTSNAFLMMVDGKPTIGVALEVFGKEIMGIPMPYDDIPLWLAHEFGHAVRYAESDCLLAQHARRNFDMADMAANVPLLEILVDEGLATQTSAAAEPDAPPNRVLGFFPDQIAWCEQNWDRLWGELAPRLDSPPGTADYTRYFGFTAKDIPPRAGYYVGWKLVRAFLDRNPGLTLADAIRRPAEDFAPL